MLRRVLLAAVAFSYLICVLVMSGMQKEDLDVSLLRKLERYNVNIADKNNAELRQECASKNKKLTIVNKDNIETDFVVTTDLTTLKTEDTSKSLNVEAVLNFLSARQEAISNLDQSTENYTHIKQDITKSTTNTFKEEPIINSNLLQRAVIKREQNSDINKYYSMAPNNNFKINKGNANIIKDIDIADEIFKNYLAQRNMASTTTEFTTTKSIINMQSVYKQINELIANKSIARIEEENSSDRYKNSIIATVHNKYNNYNENAMHESYLPLYQVQRVPNNRNHQIENMYEFLNVMKQFKADSSPPVSQNNKSNANDKQAEILDIVNQFDKAKYEQLRSDKPESAVEISKKILSPNLVKEIAETVKDVVIKDLRKEITNIYLKPTQTTIVITSTTTSTETPPPRNISIIDTPKKTGIIDKFMELYDQIKALKQTTFVLRAHNKSEGISYDFRQGQYSPLMTRPYSPIVLRDPDTKAFMPTVGNYNTKQNDNPHQNLPREEQFVEANQYFPKQDQFVDPNKNFPKEKQLVELNQYHPKEGPDQYLPKEKQFVKPNVYLPMQEQYVDPNKYLPKEKQFDEPNVYLPKEKQFVEPNHNIPKQNQFVDSNRYLLQNKQFAYPYQYLPKEKQFNEPNQYLPREKQFVESNQYLPKQFVDPNQYFPIEKQFLEPNQYLPNPKQFVDPNRYLPKEKHFVEPNQYNPTEQQFVDPNQYLPNNKQLVDPNQYLLRQFGDRNKFLPNQKQFVETNQYTSRQNQFLYSKQYHPQQTRNHHSAKTIQTNSVEIKPLAISMPKSENVISQNIIINPHTVHNPQTSDDRYNRQMFSRENKYSDTSNTHKDVTQNYISSNRYGKHNAARNPAPSSSQSIVRNQEDVIRFRIINNGKSNIDTDYYEKINFRNDKNGDTKQHIILGNRDIPRFHERLENAKDDRVPSTFNRYHVHKPEHINDDVDSRQQMSLINLKKGPSYDETHFKNFLKTQQKVTDILEKILSSKRNSSLPTSVEFA